MLLALVACSGSSGGSDAADEPTTTAVTSTTAASAGPVAAGKGSVNLGGSEQPFTVTGCVDGPGEGDTPEATQQFRLTGTTDGTPEFTVTITRYTSDSGNGVTTVTETATIGQGAGEAAVGIEAKRTSIDGKWLDLKDPSVQSALLTRRGTLVVVDGLFGPEGSQKGDSDIVAGTIRARCPA